MLELIGGIFDHKEITRFYNSTDPLDKATLKDVMSKVLYYVK